MATKHKPKHDYSIAKSMLFSIEETLGLNSLFEGKMVHYSFDCPLNLREAFNTETKENGTSGCQEARRLMAQYVFSSMVKKHALGNTMSKIAESNFSIESMNFTQNVQSRPRRYLNNSVGAELTVDGSAECMIGSCGKAAVEVGVYQLCAFHTAAYADSSDWRLKR
jgi:hypothetical protein